MCREVWVVFQISPDFHASVRLAWATKGRKIPARTPNVGPPSPYICCCVGLTWTSEVRVRVVRVAWPVRIEADDIFDVEGWEFSEGHCCKVGILEWRSVWVNVKVVGSGMVGMGQSSSRGFIPGRTAVLWAFAGGHPVMPGFDFPGV